MQTVFNCYFWFCFMRFDRFLSFASHFYTIIENNITLKLIRDNTKFELKKTYIALGTS